MKLFSYMTKKSEQKIKYLKNTKSFQDEIEDIIHHFQGAFIAANRANLFER